MEKHKKHIYKLFVLAFSLLWFAIIFTGVYHYKKAENYINQQITPLLEESIARNIELKMKNVFVQSTYIYNPKGVNKKYGEIKIVTKDTIIKKNVKLIDERICFQNCGQSYLLVAGRMHTDTLGRLFDKAIHDKGIMAKTAVSIVSHNKIKELSKDTSNFSINYRTPGIIQGDLKEITYRGYVDYTPTSIFAIMQKDLLYVLFLFELILVACFINYLIHKRRFRYNKITKLKNGNFQMGNVLINKEQKRLCTPFKEVKYTSQQYELLSLFLENAECGVSKEAIQEKFWPKSITANTSMTTSINRLRNTLADIGANVSIVTEKGERDYHLAIRHKL